MSGTFFDIMVQMGLFALCNNVPFLLVRLKYFVNNICLLSSKLNEPCREETAHTTHADNEESNHTDHVRSLIRVFVVCCQNRWIL